MRVKPQKLHKAFASSPDTRRVLLFFSGWGFPGEKLGVTVPGYDAFTLWDYTESEREGINPEELITGYDEVVVVAWSFGVKVAADFLHETKARVTRTIAVNGTETHIHDTKGIPSAIFAGTLEGLNERNFLKFMQRACGSMAEGKEFSLAIKPVIQSSDITLLHKELKLFGSLPAETTDYPWSMAIIGADDRIFPADNQCEAWQHIGNLHILPHAGHYIPFHDIARFIIDKELVSQRFTHAAQTYGSHASVQERTAEILKMKLRGATLATFPSVIEIGAGFAPIFGKTDAPADYADLEVWDIADLDASMFPTGTIIRKADAEILIDSLRDNSINLIVSSSAIQWFNSPERFISVAAGKLCAGGMLALAFYNTGTLSELALITGVTLRYPNLERLIATAQKAGLKVTTAETEELVLEFASAQDALRHLSRTGVNAIDSSRSARTAVRRFMQQAPLNDSHRITLTYKPAWLIAYKPH